MCRKYTTQERAMRSGIIDMILAIFGIAAAVADLIDLTSTTKETGVTESDKTATSHTIALLYFIIAISVVRFIMGLVLRRGARKRNEKMVMAWICSSSLLWIFQVVQFIVKLTIGIFVLWSTISSSLAIIIRVAVMYFIYRFFQEIREEKLRKAQAPNL